MTASANAGNDRIGLGAVRRSTDSGLRDMLPGVAPEGPSGTIPVPKLFRRSCPTQYPILCDGHICAQVCCEAKDGFHAYSCMYGEVCIISFDNVTACCDYGAQCDPSRSSSSGSSLPLATRTGSSAVPTPTRSREELKELIIDALENVPDIDLFAGLVKDQPALFDLLNPASDYAILAPNNAAVQGNNGGAGGGGVSPQLALAFVERESADAPLSAGPRTLKTSLTDPNYVNLGKGEPARIVSSPLAGNLSIAAGVGKSVIFGGKGESFDGGTINVGQGFFTLPEDLSTTLRGTNGTEFEKFLDSSSKLGALSDSEHITIFALTDAALASVGARLTKDTLEQNLLQGAAWYTPDLVDGEKYNTAAGGKIEITIEGNYHFVNGIRIVGPDTIMKNGVVHYVEDIIPHVDAPSIAGRPSISPFVTLLAMVAALTRYYLMA